MKLSKLFGQASHKKTQTNNDQLGIDLTEAKMPAVDLSFTDIHNVDFRGASLTQADLRNTVDFRGASMARADLRGTDSGQPSRHQIQRRGFPGP